VQTILTVQQVEQMIYRCRMRWLCEQYHGTETAARTYEAATNRWLDLWHAAKIDRQVQV
jgi:hypothetical protein